MDPEVVKIVIQRLEAGENIISLMSALKESGYDETAIDSIIKEALAQQSAKTSPTTTKPRHFSATTAFSIIGAILIIVALTVVISSTWTGVSPLMRILYLAIPMLILFGVSYLTNNKENLTSIHSMTQLTAAVMFPFVIGTFLYQTKLMPDIKANLFIASSAIGLIFYLVMEFALKKSIYAALSASSLYALAFSILANYNNTNSVAYAWTFASISLLIAGVGYLLIKMRPSDGQTFFKIGMILASLSLPAATLDILNNQSPLSDTASSLIVVAFGLAYLGLASLLYKRYNTTTDTTFYSVKRFLEEIAVILILVPLLGNSTNTSAFIFVSIILSVVYILIHIRVKIKLLLFFGIIGLAISIFTLTDRFFQGSASWPIAIFFAGFLAIGFGILVKNLSKNEHEITPYHGLGRDEKAEIQEKRSIGASILIWLLGIYLCVNILGLIFSFFIMRRF